MLKKNTPDWEIFLADLKEMPLVELRREEYFLLKYIKESKPFSDTSKFHYDCIKQCELELEPVLAEIASRLTSNSCVDVTETKIPSSEQLENFNIADVDFMTRHYDHISIMLEGLSFDEKFNKFIPLMKTFRAKAKEATSSFKTELGEVRSEMASSLESSDCVDINIMGTNTSSGIQLINANVASVDIKHDSDTIVVSNDVVDYASSVSTKDSITDSGSGSCINNRRAGLLDRVSNTEPRFEQPSKPLAETYSTNSRCTNIVSDSNRSMIENLMTNNLISNQPTVNKSNIAASVSCYLLKRKQLYIILEPSGWSNYLPLHNKHERYTRQYLGQLIFDKVKRLRFQILVWDPGTRDKVGQNPSKYIYGTYV